MFQWSCFFDARHARKPTRWFWDISAVFWTLRPLGSLGIQRAPKGLDVTRPLWKVESTGGVRMIRIWMREVRPVNFSFIFDLGTFHKNTHHIHLTDPGTFFPMSIGCFSLRPCQYIWVDFHRLRRNVRPKSQRQRSLWGQALAMVGAAQITTHVSPPHYRCHP